jgi:predicted ATP-dependent serine protease
MYSPQYKCQDCGVAKRTEGLCDKCKAEWDMFAAAIAEKYERESKSG